jgi:hypothetical protein
MKVLYLPLLIAILFSCKKTVQEAQQNAIVQAMVSGQWKISSYIKGSTNITSDFTNYKFQFKENQTVDAIYNGTVEETGTWNGDVATKTISSNFSNASYPLDLLNGTWLLTDYSYTSEIATQTVNGETRTLRLDKL